MATSGTKIALAVGCGILGAVLVMFAGCTGCIAVIGHKLNEAESEKAAAIGLVTVMGQGQEVQGDYLRLTGKVVNHGTDPVSYVKVEAKLLDAQLKVLDSDWTYAVSSEKLGPGEEKTFEISIRNNPRASKVEYRVLAD